MDDGAGEIERQILFLGGVTGCVLLAAGEGIKNSGCLMTDLAGPFPHSWVLSQPQD